MSIALQEQAVPVESGGGGGGDVASVFGRTGAVVAVDGDYTSDQITNASGVSGTNVSDALDALDTDLATAEGTIVTQGTAITARAIGAASSVDNTLPRFDGTGGKQLQTTGVVVDDSNNISGVGNITLSGTVDGVDVSSLSTTVGTKADVNFSINTQTGTTYTLVLGDAGKLIDMSNAGAIALTIPANATVAFPVGTIITVLQSGAGQVTVGITTDTLNGRNGLKTAGQWAVITLIKRTSTTWVLSGDSTT